MRRLMLLRHAKSDWSKPGGSDFDRALAERGRRAAPLIGSYLARHGLIPDVILCSPAARTRATCDLVIKALGRPAPVEFNERLYNASSEAVTGIIQTVDPSVRTLLVIGHNPSMAEVAIALIASGDIEARERLHEKFPTAGLAVIDFPLEDWAGLHPQSGRLDRFIVPQVLEGATE